MDTKVLDDQVTQYTTEEPSKDANKALPQERDDFSDYVLHRQIQEESESPILDGFNRISSVEDTPSKGENQENSASASEDGSTAKTDESGEAQAQQGSTTGEGEWYSEEKLQGRHPIIKWFGRKVQEREAQIASTKAASEQFRTEQGTQQGLTPEQIEIQRIYGEEVLEKGGVRADPALDPINFVAYFGGGLPSALKHAPSAFVGIARATSNAAIGVAMDTPIDWTTNKLFEKLPALAPLAPIIQTAAGMVSGMSIEHMFEKSMVRTLTKAGIDLRLNPEKLADFKKYVYTKLREARVDDELVYRTLQDFKNDLTNIPASVERLTPQQQEHKLAQTLLSPRATAEQVISEKAFIKDRLLRGIRDGEIDGAVRFGSVKELMEAQKSGRWPISEEYGVIHAQPILGRGDDVFAAYGPYDSHNVAMIFPKKAIREKPDAHTKEVLIDEKVSPRDVKFILPGSDKLWSADELKNLSTKYAGPDKVTYVNSRQYARDLEAKGVDRRTPEQKMSDRRKLEREHDIIKSVKDEIPPPSRDTAFFGKPYEEQKRLMEEWKQRVNKTIDERISSVPASVERVKYTPDELSVANDTSRSSGAVGKNAITPRYVRETAQDGERILDFGAGKDAMHAKQLKEEGLDVTAHEFGGNMKAGVHDPEALMRQYDTVYASNVLNVQKDVAMLQKTLGQINDATVPGGRAVFNYPESPRKSNLSVQEMETAIKSYFGDVKIVGGTKAAPIWEARKTAEIPELDLAKIDHVGIREARQMGLVSQDEAVIIDSLMQSFPESWREHFEPRWSSQTFRPTEEQLRAHGMTHQEAGKLKGILMPEKIGELQEDARHLAIMFRGSNIDTFAHELGEFIHARVISKTDVRDVVNPLYRDYKKTAGSDAMQRNEWFSEKFKEWWLGTGENVPEPMMPIFRKVLDALKRIYGKLVGKGSVPKNLETLFEDIITEGRDILSRKIYYTDEEVVRRYVTGTAPTKAILDAQGFSENAKTFISFDPGTICPKQEAFADFLLKTSKELGLTWKQVADPKFLADAYDEARRLGIETPCSYCYVEKARRKALEYHAEGKTISGVNFAQAKIAFTTVEYKDAILKWSPEKIDAVNQRGGLRLFSFSDYVSSRHRVMITKLLDDAKERGLSVKAITKNPEFVEHFGDRGITINVSVDLNPHGVDGMHWSKAYELKKQYPNVKVRCVAKNMEELDHFLNLRYRDMDSFIDVVTPYHHDNPDEPMPTGAIEMGHGSKGGKMVEDYVKTHPGSEKRICCLVGGKCFSDTHQKQCSSNCGGGAQNLTVPADIEKIAQGVDVPKTTGQINFPYVKKADWEIKANKFLTMNVTSMPEKAGKLNLLHIAEPDDIKKMIVQTGDAFADEIEQFRRGYRSNADTLKVATESEKVELERLIGRKVGQAMNAEEILKTRILLTHSANQLHEMAKKVQTMGATKQDELDFRKMLNIHYAVQAQMAGMAAEAGRALQIFRMDVNQGMMQERTLRNLLNNMDGAVPTRVLAEKIAALDDPTQIGKFVNGAVEATTPDMIMEYWINALLSGPRTHMANGLSNFLTLAGQIPTRYLAAGMHKMFGKGAGVVNHEANELVYGMVTSVWDAFKVAAKAFKNEQGRDWGKLEHRTHAITGNNFVQLPWVKKLTAGKLEQGGWFARAIDALGSFIRIPGRLLVAEDEFFKEIAYRGELQATAYRKVYVEKGLNGQDAIDEMEKIMADPKTYAPEVHMGAQNFANYVTYTNDLSDQAQRVVNGARNIPGVGWAVKILFPFIRTPTNILKMAGAHSPLAFMSQGFMDAFKRGGADRDIALARMSLGTMAMVSASGLVLSGNVTGGGPKDPGKRAALMRQGWQPYSFKLGDKYYSYNRLEPLGMILGLAADFSEMAGLAGEEMQPEIDNLAGTIIASISKNITSKTWLKGMTDFVNAVSDSDRYMEKFIQSYAGTLIPTGSSQLETALDPTSSAIYSVMDKIQSRIPGLSASLPPKRNLWGEEISAAIDKDAPNTFSSFMYQLTSPIYVSKDKASPIDKELVRLGINIPMPEQKQTFDGIRVELDPIQYDRFMTTLNTVELGSTGMNLKKSLDDLVTHDTDYKDATVEDKEVMIRKLFGEARSIAKGQMLENDARLAYVVETLLEMKQEGR